MGFLHNGHISLIEKAVKDCDHVWVSIFINPIQFNNQNDLDNYPKNLKKDLNLIKSISEKINVFSPSIDEMYDDGLRHKNYNFDGIGSELEGRFRPKHFSGVATIVSKLFDLFKPNKAFFGEKDFQQTQIIRKLIEIEKHKTELIICPTVREKNGLAMSSRNSLLSKKNREKASLIFQNLLFLKKNYKKNDFEELILKCKENIDSNKDFKTEYLEIVDSYDFKILNKFVAKKSLRVFICVKVGDVRLIDNILLN
jgi:pantoate--beta-alanine ligase